MTIEELAERIFDVSDLYDMKDQYDTEEDALNAIIESLNSDPYEAIAYLLDLVEELQA